MSEQQREQLRQAAIAAWSEYKNTGLYLTDEEADRWLADLEDGKRPSLRKCHV